MSSNTIGAALHVFGKAAVNHGCSSLRGLQFSWVVRSSFFFVRFASGGAGYHRGAVAEQRRAAGNRSETPPPIMRYVICDLIGWRSSRTAMQVWGRGFHSVADATGVHHSAGLVRRSLFSSGQKFPIGWPSPSNDGSD